MRLGFPHTQPSYGPGEGNMCFFLHTMRAFSDSPPLATIAGCARIAAALRQDRYQSRAQSWAFRQFQNGKLSRKSAGTNGPCSGRRSTIRIERNRIAQLAKKSRRTL